jgi:hypothetical protein
MNPLFEMKPESLDTHPRQCSAEVSRILTAAVINKRFQKKLLENPIRAIDGGYGGERFHLSIRERRMVAAIKANTIEDFASQLIYSRERITIALPIAAGD